MAFICRNVTYAIFLVFGTYRLVELILKSNAYSENVFEIHGTTDSKSFATAHRTVQYMPIRTVLEKSL